MKILITQDTDWIKRNPGQQHHLAERLIQRGHEIRVIDYEILWKEEENKELISERQVFKNVSKIFNDSNVTVIRPKIIKIPILDYFSMLFTYNNEIERQIKEFRPDVIIGHSILTNYLSMRFSHKFNIPFIFQMTDAQHTIIPYRILQPVGKKIERKILKNSDEVVVINELLKEYAIGMGANSQNTHVIRAGIDADIYDPNIDGTKIREQYGITSDEKVIFFMGWLYHFSGLKEVAIEIAKNKKEYSKLKFMIVGEGDAFEDLNSIIAKYKLHKNVILTGQQPFKKIPEFIAAADVCILPAYLNRIMNDIVPIKIYEYMAMGKPVITTKLPGVMKEFGDNNGVIYINNPEDVIQEFFKIDSYSEGLKARKFVENNDWDNIVDQFQEILTNIVN